MAYNTQAAERINKALLSLPDRIAERVSKKKMFGGLSFLYDGKMALGLVKDDLAVRVVAEKMNSVLSDPHVRPMDFTKRPMKEFIYVNPEGYRTEEQLHYYLELGLEHAMKAASSNRSPDS